MELQVRQDVCSLAAAGKLAKLNLHNHRWMSQLCFASSIPHFHLSELA